MTQNPVAAPVVLDVTYASIKSGPADGAGHGNLAGRRQGALDRAGARDDVRGSVAHEWKSPAAEAFGSGRTLGALPRWRRRIMAQARLSVRVNRGNPDHHLFNNNGTWWVHFTVHRDDFTKHRVRRSLGTRCVAAARRLRDEVLAGVAASGAIPATH